MQKTWGSKLTTLNFQGAILFVQRVSPQIHHAGCRRRDSEPEGKYTSLGINVALSSAVHSNITAEETIQFNRIWQECVEADGKHA